MTGDQSANDENHTEVCEYRSFNNSYAFTYWTGISTPALFEDGNVMGAQDICAVQENQLH